MLDALPAFDGRPEPSLARHRAALQFMAGEPAALEALGGADRTAAYAQIATIATGRGDIGQAIHAYRHALVLAQAGLPEGAPALRALAVAGNNLAAALEEKIGRSDDETLAMVEAAEGGLTYWRRAGGWLEEERAAYRLARSQLQAGLATQALASAELCLSVCTLRGAPPFELFFAHAATALAHRACGHGTDFARAHSAAMAAYAKIEAADKPWCADDLRELGDTPT